MYYFAVSCFNFKMATDTLKEVCRTKALILLLEQAYVPAQNFPVCVNIH